MPGVAGLRTLKRAEARAPSALQRRRSAEIPPVLLLDDDELRGERKACGFHRADVLCSKLLWRLESRHPIGRRRLEVWPASGKISTVWTGASSGIVPRIIIGL